MAKRQANTGSEAEPKPPEQPSEQQELQPEPVAEQQAAPEQSPEGGAEQEPKTAAEQEQGPLPGRILRELLIDGVKYKPNQVVRFGPEYQQDLSKAGSVDFKEGAVKYCLDEGAKIVEHAPAGEPKAEQTSEDGDEGEIAE